MGRVKCSTVVPCRGTHFTYKERIRLQKMLLTDRITNRRVLCELLGKSKRTIIREIHRGAVLHSYGNPPFERLEYNAWHAELDARSHDGAKGPDYKIGRDLRLLDEISRLMRASHPYSPYAVIQRFNLTGWPTDTRICEKTLCKHIHEGLVPSVDKGSLLLKGVRHGTGNTVRRHSNAENAARTIDRRPKSANDRSEFGHWEGDTVAGGTGKGTGCILTLTERMQRIEKIRPLASRKSRDAVSELDTLEKTLGSGLFKRIFKSITFDNGCEFSDCVGMEASAITKGRRTILCYAHPYTSCERGTNENHNRIARRFFPKGCCFRDYRNKDAREAQDWMNTYPRRILGGETPLGKLEEELGFVPDFFKSRNKEVRYG